jgi:hypothetical protein
LGIFGTKCLSAAYRTVPYRTVPYRTVPRSSFEAYRIAYCTLPYRYYTETRQIRGNSKMRRIFDHLATVQISVFEFRNSRQYILLLLLPLNLGLGFSLGLSGKQLPMRWSLRRILCSIRSFQMLITFAGELQKTSRQLPLTLIFEGIKSTSLLLSLNLMGSDSSGRSRGRSEVAANVTKVARGTLTGMCSINNVM